MTQVFIPGIPTETLTIAITITITPHIAAITPPTSPSPPVENPDALAVAAAMGSEPNKWALVVKN